MDLGDECDVGAGVEGLDGGSHAGETGSDNHYVVLRFHRFDATRKPRPSASWLELRSSSLLRIGLIVAIPAAVVVLVGGSNAATHARQAPPRAVYGGLDPHSLDLAGLVPRGGTVDGVWFVPAGLTRPQIAIVWHLRAPRAAWAWGGRWYLTLWSPEGKTRYDAVRWIPHQLIRSSPWPMELRIADVTHDGHADLLVSVVVTGANHVLEVVSVFATFGRHVRRIYGRGEQQDQLGHRVYGRSITESAWGARRGLLWFDEPRGGQAVCCPDYRLKYTLRWTSRGWRTASRRLVRIRYR
jgi:hypothetical protein